MQRFEAVPYYQPPTGGNRELTDDEIGTLPAAIQLVIAANKKTQQQHQVTSLPIHMQDALHVERCWRNLTDDGVKWYLKWQYIHNMPQAPLWRKLKHYNIRIKSHADHDIFDRRALDVFAKSLKTSP